MNVGIAEAMRRIKILRSKVRGVREGRLGCGVVCLGIC
jgi:hypothetical protein